MHDKQVEAKIRELWDAFWSNGIANSLSAIEQITYLIFLKQLEVNDDTEATRVRNSGAAYDSRLFPGGRTDPHRWSVLAQESGDALLPLTRDAFDWLKTVNDDARERLRDAVFIIPTVTLLRRAIGIIDELFARERTAQSQDLLGDIYEMLLNEVAEAGKNGQFRTPRHIIRALCYLADPQPNERILDPACGSAGFLINAYDYILTTYSVRDDLYNPKGGLAFEPDGTAINAVGDDLETFFPNYTETLATNLNAGKAFFQGYDFDRTMVRLGWMNTTLHKLPGARVTYADTLGKSFNADQLVARTNDYSPRDGGYGVVFANPPYTGSLDRSELGASLTRLNTGKTELLFVQLIMQMLATGGRAAIIVADGVLFGSTKAHRDLRQRLIKENQLNAVISLPGGVFQPYTGVKTSVLVFARGGTTERVWFYEVGADGLTLNAKRDPKPESNDLWDMIVKYRLRFQKTLRRPQPAFVDDATWQRWQGIATPDAPAAWSSHYARPIISTPPDVLFMGLDTQPLPDVRDVKDWTVEVATLAENDYNLSAGRYKPMPPDSVAHEPPAQLIRDLQGIETQIQQRLARLLALVENKE